MTDRKIKFRAWGTPRGGSHKVMSEVNLMDTYKDNFGYRYQTFWTEAGVMNGAVSDDEAVLMQYTGLKDKNGVEIYEGDIYQRVYEDRKRYPSQPKRVVGWTVNRFNVRDTDNVEVVGNIYENPELLK